MIENYHPGFGDHRWLLVTHFVGCKPCGKFEDYPVERCLKQMDRAYNFRDNKILQLYDFTHKSLVSRRDQIFGGGNSPAFVVAAVAALISGFLADRFGRFAIQLMEFFLVHDYSLFDGSRSALTLQF